MAIKSLKHSSLTDNAFYRSVLAGNAPYIPVVSAYDLLETTTLTTSANSISFTGLGSYATDYKHLQVRYIGRCASANTNNGFEVYINADTGSNYTYHRIVGNGSTVGTFGSTSAFAQGIVGRITGGNADAGTYGAGLVDFLDFGSTQKNKTIRGLGGYANTAGAGYHIRLDSVAWLNTAAITSLTFKAQTGSEDFIAGTRLSLIGIK
tara:strand:- start:486 stop:1106 length:621 start_codon:yes stop_codon:yes gene_type:complete